MKILLMTLLIMILLIMTRIPLWLFNMQFIIFYFAFINKVIYKYNQLKVNSVISNATFINVISKVVMSEVFISIVLRRSQ